MIRVRTTTGADLVVGEHTISPTEWTEVEEKTKEMEFYAPLLAFEEVDEEGNPVYPTHEAPKAEDDEEDDLTDEELEDIAKERGYVLVLAADHEDLTRQVETLEAERDSARTDLATATSARETAESALSELRGQVEASAADLKEPPAPNDPNPALQEAVDAVLSSSAGALERLPEEALVRLAKAKGLDPVPDSKAKLVEALKPKE